jgi:hypothetical protein
MPKKLDYAKDPEAVEQNHAFHCLVHEVPVERRTLYTCRCHAKERYQKEFNTRRGITEAEKPKPIDIKPVSVGERFFLQWCTENEVHPNAGMLDYTSVFIEVLNDFAKRFKP